jgi:hypothetical protein
LFAGIAQLMGNLMCSDEGFQETRDRGIDLCLAGKGIVITLKTEIIARIAVQRWLDGTESIVK